jgi:hypothetical protein
MVREKIAAVRALVEFVALDHRAHRAIEDENALIEKSAKFGSAIGLHQFSRNKKPREAFAGPVRVESVLRGSLAFFSLVASGPANHSRFGEPTRRAAALSN